MQLKKIVNKIQKSYSKFLEAYVLWEKMSLVFVVPRISIKRNANIVDKLQIDLNRLSKINRWLKLNTIKTLKWTLIESIEFEDEYSYLKFINKTKDFEIFCDNVEIIKNFNFLNEWLKVNYNIINDYNWKWKNILKVLRYFLTNPKKYLYIRELEIDIDTKFIEKNKNIIEKLLLFIDLQQDWVFSFEWKKFEEKFWLKIKPNFIRFRFLDKNLDSNFLWAKVDDISLKISDFCKIKNSFKKVFIVENEINYLTFPFVENAIIIWWKWFKISHLKDILWLKQKQIYYFWDLDSHWFKILAQCRKYFPNTKSIFMTKEIFNLYKGFIWKWKIIWKEELFNLNQYLEEDEFELFKYINENKLRLEQENIRHDFIIKNLI